MTRTISCMAHGVHEIRQRFPTTNNFTTALASLYCGTSRPLAFVLCPLHISRSDAPIGLRCSRRQFGTKPSDGGRRRVGTPFTLAEWRAMCPFASVGTRESYNIVRLPGWYGERVLFITTLSCVVHVRLPIGRRRRAILNMFNIAR